MNYPDFASDIHSTVSDSIADAMFEVNQKLATMQRQIEEMDRKIANLRKGRANARPLVTCLVIGDARSGKTTFLQRCSGMSTSDTYEHTSDGRDLK
jgi:50S ribosomal subunit-associated GTPase HflX